MTPVTIAQLSAAPTVDLMTAACALGLGRTKAYDLARRQQFPCRVLRIGDTNRVPTAGLLEPLWRSGFLQPLGLPIRSLCAPKSPGSSR